MHGYYLEKNKKLFRSVFCLWLLLHITSGCALMNCLDWNDRPQVRDENEMTFSTRTRTCTRTEIRSVNRAAKIKAISVIYTHTQKRKGKRKQRGSKRGAYNYKWLMCTSRGRETRSLVACSLSGGEQKPTMEAYHTRRLSKQWEKSREEPRRAERSRHLKYGRGAAATASKLNFTYTYICMHSIHDLFLMVLSKHVSLLLSLYFSLCLSVHASRLLLVIMFAPKCRKIVDTAAGMRLSASAFVWVCLGLDSMERWDTIMQRHFNG